MPLRLRLSAGFISLFAALGLTVASLTPALAETAPDYAIFGGWFFTQTGGGQGLGCSVKDDGTDSNAIYRQDIDNNV